MRECIIPRGLDAPAKFAPSLEVRVGNAWYRRGKQNMDRWKCIKAAILALVIKNSNTFIVKSLLALEASTTRMPLGGRLLGVNHCAPPIRTHMCVTLKISHTQTSSLIPAATSFMNTDLYNLNTNIHVLNSNHSPTKLTYHYLNIAKLLQRIKFI